MAKVGPVITVPSGSCCHITLDSTEHIVITHVQDVRGVAVGTLTIDHLKMFGLHAETVFRLDLDTPEGKVVLADLTNERHPGPPRPPLRAFVTYLQRCRSVAEVVARCQGLLFGPGRSGAGGPL